MDFYVVVLSAFFSVSLYSSPEHTSSRTVTFVCDILLIDYSTTFTVGILIKCS